MAERKKPILLAAPTPILTPRLAIRPFQAGDGAALNEAKIETWDQLTKVFQWAHGTPDLAQDEAYARRSLANYILREDFNFVGTDRKTGEHLVYIGLHPHDWNLGAFQIGYWTRKSAQRQGHAKEAANALIRYAFNALGANRLVMCHVDGNERSKKIITSLGLDHEGLRRNSLLFAGDEIRDAQWYSRIDAEGLPELDVNWGPDALS